MSDLVLRLPDPSRMTHHGLPRNGAGKGRGGNQGMLIPAMAFAWCVISAQAEAETAARNDAAMAASKRQASLQAQATPPIIDGQQLSPIRTAIPANVIDFAKTLVNLPMGAQHIERIDGQRYVFVLERHYHPPGFVGAPSGWHKGVTAYELKTPVSAD